MSRFNLSEWAITHRPLVLFMILILGAAGAYSYLNLGRAEDPSFTIKNMVVNVTWPGATSYLAASVAWTSPLPPVGSGLRTANSSLERPPKRNRHDRRAASPGTGNGPVSIASPVAAVGV